MRTGQTTVVVKISIALQLLSALAYLERQTSPVELDSLGKIPGSLATGIANLLHRMLEIDASSRQNASEFQDAWEGIFKVAVERAQALEGRAFP